MMHSTQSFHSLKLAALVVSLLASPCVALATTLIVPTQHPTIQGALNAARNGDTVLVRPGTYPGSILRFSGKAIHLKSTNGPAVTKIQGNGVNTVFSVDQGETRATIIEGFTISGGVRIWGGGMVISGTSPVVRGNIFTGNRAVVPGSGTDGRGGAILVANAPANPLIAGNLFTNNEAEAYGGAIHTTRVPADIRDNIFINNRATTAGGAIMSTASNAAVNIVGNTFTQNTADAGGAISAFGASVIIKENVITNNGGGLFGGGIHLETQVRVGNQTYTVRNNRIEGNRATSKGGGIVTYMENTASPIDISHNVIIGNTCLDPTCASQGTCGSGGGLGSFNGTGAMTVRDNLIRDNVADLHGAAVFTGMPLVFTDNQVINNQAHRAQPGMTVVGTFATQIARNTFRSNHFTATGGDRTQMSAGAIRIQNSRQGALLEGNLFIANQGMQAGAAMVSGGDSLTPHLTGNTFVGNRLQEPKDPSGGALWMQDNGTVCNNTFTGNDMSGIRIRRLSSPAFIVRVSFNHFFGNSTALLYDPPAIYTSVAALNAATTIANNNIDGNPLFASDGSYRLSSVSPLIGKANSACFRLATDVQGEPRPQPADIGGDEFSLRGPDTTALFQPASSRFYLRNSNTNGGADSLFQYGPANSGRIPLAGDWNGDGIVTTGFFDRATNLFRLRNSNTAGVDDVIFQFAAPSATSIPLAGDWDGNRTTTVGFYRPETGQFLLRNRNTSGGAEIISIFGVPNFGVPLVGDWNGDGRQTVGLFRPSTSTFYLRNSNTGGVTNITFNYGSANAGWLPITGDWNGDQIAGVGLYRPATSTFFLRNSLTTGTAETTFNFVIPAGTGWRPLAGQWDGF